MPPLDPIEPYTARIRKERESFFTELAKNLFLVMSSYYWRAAGRFFVVNGIFIKEIKCFFMCILKDNFTFSLKCSNFCVISSFCNQKSRKSYVV